MSWSVCETSWSRPVPPNPIQVQVWGLCHTELLGQDLIARERGKEKGSESLVQLLQWILLPPANHSFHPTHLNRITWNINPQHTHLPLHLSWTKPTTHLTRSSSSTLLRYDEERKSQLDFSSHKKIPYTSSSFSKFVSRVTYNLLFLRNDKET